MNHLLNVATVCALCSWKHVTSSSAVCGLPQCSFWCLIRWSWGHLEWVMLEVTVVKQWRIQSLLTKLSFFFPMKTFCNLYLIFWAVSPDRLPYFLSKDEWVTFAAQSWRVLPWEGNGSWHICRLTNLLQGLVSVFPRPSAPCQSNQPLHVKI